MASGVSDESCNRCVGGAHGPKDSLSMLWLVVVDDDWPLLFRKMYRKAVVEMLEGWIGFTLPVNTEKPEEVSWGSK